MNAEKDLSEQLKGYAEILLLLEKNLTYVESLGISEGLLRDYRNVLDHLRRKSPSEVSKILGRKSPKKTPLKDAQSIMTDDEISRLTGDQIEPFLDGRNVSRSFLERLAAVRFGVTRGALSMLRSREALTEKIRTLVTHEDTHEAISRAALGQVDPMSSN